MKRILTLLLALVIGIGVLPPVHSHAATHIHTDYAVLEFIYERRSDAEGDIDTYAICGGCKERYLYHSSGRGEHSWSQAEVANTTCTTDGYYILECSICHAKEKTITYKATGHRFGDWKVVKEASCLEAGERQHECEECHTVEKEAIPVVEHEWTEWKETKEAACTEAGEEMRSCESCKKEEKRELAAKGHSFGEWTVAKAASCKEAGQEKRTCAACNTEETREIAKTEHQWGTWTETKQAGHGQKGEEERTCKVCKEKETRVVDGDKPLAQAGSKGLAVLMTQHLLTMGGEYAGETDGVMNEALADAIRVFETANGFPETGVIYADTLQTLNERYLASFEGKLPRQGMLQAWKSGLRTRLILEDHCTSNEDGTHKNAAVVTGVQYLYGQEEMTLSLPEDKQHAFPEITESCAFMNEALTCTKCGYRQNFAWMFASGIGGISLRDFHEVVYLNTTEDLGLGLIQNIGYEDELESMCWDPVEGADRYHVVIEKDGEQVVTEYVENSLLHRNYWHEYGEGTYLWWIQAEDSDGEPLSNNTNISWEEDGGKMPSPQALSLQYAMASWDFPYNGYNARFVVYVQAMTPGEDGYDWKLLLDTETDAMQMDLKDIYFKNTDLPYGTKLRLGVQTKDLNGTCEDSDVYEVLADYIRPDFLRLSHTVNVRAGAGKSHERIGSLPAGSCVLCWDHVTGEDGTYALISYEGGTGYVNEVFLSWFQPVEFEVPVYWDDREEYVPVNVDGTLNREVFAQKVKKTGYLVSEILNSGAGELQAFDWNTVLTENSILNVRWEPDPAYTRVIFRRNTAAMSFKDPVTGEVYPYYLLQHPSAPDVSIVRIDKKDVFAFARENNGYWNTRDDGTGITVNHAGEIPSGTEVTLFLVEYSDKDFVLGDNVLGWSLMDEIYPTPKVDYANRVGFLQKGDKIRILETVNTYEKKDYVHNGEILQYEVNFYKIFHYRLNTECYILTAALDNASSLGGYAVQFDADGGWCAVKMLTARKSNGYKLKELPKPAKDGHTFVGWTNEKGELVDTDEAFTKDCTLKAKWRAGYYSTKIGVIRPSEYFRSGNRDPKYYDVFLYDDEALTEGKQRVYSGTQVKIIGEGDDVYYCVFPDGREGWLSKENVSTGFTGMSISSGNVYTSRAICNNAYFNGTKRYRVDLGSYVYCIGVQESQAKFAATTPDDRFSRFPVVWEDNRIFAHEGEFEDGFLESHFGWLDFELTFSEFGGRNNYCYLNFDPQGGYCNEEGRTVKANRSFGSLPEAVFPGKEFLGWYTEPHGGAPVTEDSKYGDLPGSNRLDAENKTIYAHWSDEGGKEYRTVDQKREIYEAPDIASGRVGYAEPGDVMVLLNGREYQNDNGYQFVTCNGTSGYIKTSKLIPVKPIRLRRIEHGKKNQRIYYAPYYNDNFGIKEIVDGETVFTKEYDGKGWVPIVFKGPKNSTAYVRAEYVDPESWK